MKGGEISPEIGKRLAEFKGEKEPITVEILPPPKLLEEGKYKGKIVRIERTLREVKGKMIEFLDITIAVEKENTKLRASVTFYEKPSRRSMLYKLLRNFGAEGKVNIVELLEGKEVEFLLKHKILDDGTRFMKVDVESIKPVKGKEEK